MYEQNKGREVAEKLKEQIEQEQFENEYSNEVKNFNIIEYLYEK